MSFSNQLEPIFSSNRNFATDMKSMRPLRKVPTHENKLKLDFKPQKPKLERALRPEYLKPLGAPVTLEVIVRGRPKPDFTWYFQSEEITKENTTYSMTVLNDRCMLHILELTSETEGQYTFRAINEHGQATTSTQVVVGEYEETAPLEPEQPMPADAQPQLSQDNLVMLHYKVGTSQVTDTAVTVTQSTAQSEIVTRDTFMKSTDSRLQYLPGPMEGFASEELPSQKPKSSAKTMGQQAREFASKIIPKPVWPFSLWSGSEQQPMQPGEFIDEAPHPAGVRPEYISRESIPGEVVPDAAKKPTLETAAEKTPAVQPTLEYLAAHKSPLVQGTAVQPLQPGEFVPQFSQSTGFFTRPGAPQFASLVGAQPLRPAFIRPGHPAYRPLLGVTTTPSVPSVPEQDLVPVSAPQHPQEIIGDGDGELRKPIEVHMVPTRAGRWVPARKVAEPGTAPKFTCPLEEVFVTLGQPAT